MIASPIVGPMFNALRVFTPADKAAYTSVFGVASGDFQAGMSGEYLVPVAKVGKVSKVAKDEELAAKLWDWTETELKGKALI